MVPSGATASAGSLKVWYPSVPEVKTSVSLNQGICSAIRSPFHALFRSSRAGTPLAVDIRRSWSFKPPLRRSGLKVAGPGPVYLLLPVLAPSGRAVGLGNIRFEAPYELIERLLRRPVRRIYGELVLDQRPLVLFLEACQHMLSVFVAEDLVLVVETGEGPTPRPEESLRQNILQA